MNFSIRNLISEILREPLPRFELDDHACAIIKQPQNTYTIVVYSLKNLKLIVNDLKKNVRHEDKFATIAAVSYFKPKGSCWDAGIVEMSASNPLYGAGPIAYEIAMWHAGKLTSSRESVSTSARSVWQKYDKRNDIISQPFDDEWEPVTPDPEDDCTLNKPEGTIEKRSAINKAHSRSSKEKPEYLDSLIANHEKGLKIYSPLEKKTMSLEAFLIVDSNKLFAHVYF
jgi:hypothetical protein